MKCSVLHREVIFHIPSPFGWEMEESVFKNDNFCLESIKTYREMSCLQPPPTRGGDGGEVPKHFLLEIA